MSTNCENNCDICSETSKICLKIKNNDIIKVNCSKEEILNNNCKDEYLSSDQILEIYYALKNQIQNNNTNNTLIITKNAIFQITKIENQKSNIELSTIDLEDCEKIIRSEYKIPESESLIIFKTDLKTEYSPTSYVQYEIYHPYSLKQIDLSICGEEKISINVPSQLDENTINLYNNLILYGYNLFDSFDEFYNDICSQYTSVNNTDILLKDRKENIFILNANVSLCQSGCVFKSFNSSLKKVFCECNSETLNITNLKDTSFSKLEIANSFFITLSNSNFRVLKCYELVFSKNGQIKNIGSILLIIIIVVYVILAIIFIFLGNDILTKMINSVINNKLSFLENQLKFHRSKTKSSSIILNSNLALSIKSHDKNAIEIKKKRNRTKFIDNIKNNENKISELSNKNKNIINTDSITVNKKNANRKKTKKFSIIGKKNSDPPKKEGKIIHKSKHNKGEESYNKNSTLRNSSGKNFSSKNYFSNFNINLVQNIVPEKINKDNNDIRKILKENCNNIGKSIKKLPKKTLKTIKYINYNTLNDNELNTLDYEVAINYDKRTYFQYYFGLLKKRQIIIFTFYTKDDYNLILIKIIIFLLSLSLYLTLNCFFYNDNIIHKIFENCGVYELVYRLPQVIYSTLITTVINFLLKMLSLSEKDIVGLKNKESIIDSVKIAENFEKWFKIRIIIFFGLSTGLFLFFWYFLACFCAVFSNTQQSLLKDSLISFGISMIYPFFWDFVPGFLRTMALNDKNKKKKKMYQISNILSLI